MNEAFVRIQCRWIMTWSTNRLRFLFHSWVIYDKTIQFLFSKENLGIWLTYRHSLHSIAQMLTKFQATACRGLGEQWFSPARINDFSWNNSSRIILHKIAANLGFERQWNIVNEFFFHTNSNSKREKEREQQIESEREIKRHKILHDHHRSFFKWLIWKETWTLTFQRFPFQKNDLRLTFWEQAVLDPNILNMGCRTNHTLKW